VLGAGRRRARSLWVVAHSAGDWRCSGRRCWFVPGVAKRRSGKAEVPQRIVTREARRSSCKTQTRLQ